MPDLDLIKQGEQGVRDRRGRFAGGRSGNPAGRPRGCRNYVNRAAGLLLARALAIPTEQQFISPQPQRASGCRGGRYRR
jgi:hypothetical protein